MTRHALVGHADGVPCRSGTPVVHTVVDALARVLIRLTDTVASRSCVPNPMALSRVVLTGLADQHASGADFIDHITWLLTELGFTWPAGLCRGCDAPLTEEQAESEELCAACDP